MLKRFYMIALLCVFFSGTALADAVAEEPSKREMLRIAEKLRCAVCQNQPVSESNSGLANDMRIIISEQLAAGKTEEEIIDYFVSRYGDYVLLKPRKTGTGFVLWVLPPLILIFAGGFAWLAMRSRNGVEDHPGKTLSDEDRERIRRARKEDDEE